MKKVSILMMFIAACVTCGMTYGCSDGGDKDIASLEEGFKNPPSSARAGVYWYFMDGNFSREGVTKDLEAMKEAGIGHVLFLEVNVGVPRGKVDFLSEEWQERFAFMVHECERLEIGITLGIGPGWTLARMVTRRQTPYRRKIYLCCVPSLQPKFPAARIGTDGTG
jgi:hypothetical protein